MLYDLAVEYEQGGDAVNARRVYFELTKQRPKSRYVPNAYMAFGELFLGEAQRDPGKWKLACYAYVKVAGYPPPGNTVHAHAWLRLAQILEHFQDRSHAQWAYQRVLYVASRYPEVSGVADLKARVPDWARDTTASSNAVPTPTPVPAALSAGTQAPATLPAAVDAASLPLNAPLGGPRPLSPEQVRVVVVSHTGALRACYELEAQKVPSLRGVVAVGWTIDPSGHVIDTKIVEATVDKAMQDCIVRQVASWSFPAANAPTVVAAYPFRFGLAQ